MNVKGIFDTISKGVGIIKTLAAAGQEIAPAVEVVAKLVTGAQSGKVTSADLDATEAALDRMIDDFNDPL